MSSQSKLPKYIVTSLDRVPILKKSAKGYLVRVPELISYLQDLTKDSEEEVKVILGYLINEILDKPDDKTAVDSFELGDFVVTTKGCRNVGCFDTLEIIGLNKKWGRYAAVMCKKEDGSKRLFLCKNLVRSKEYGNV